MSNKARFSRADWVALGLARLSDAGTEAIKLEAICAAAGLTRGSFYYHFSDHGDFLIALTQGWADKQTRDVAEQAEGAKGPDVAAQLLTDAALQIDYRLELGIRELARRVPEVAALVKTTDAARLAILAELFQARFGLAADAAQRFAFLEYAAFCGAILLEPHISAQKQAELAALLDQSLACAAKST